MTTTRPTICLAIIMKNEGPLLPRLFDSVKGFATEYCIVDTGSTDDTIDVLKSMDMPGTIFEEAFVDFGTTRNFLLDKCRQTTTCEYLLLLDADMVLCVSPEWDAAKLDNTIDVYSVIQVSSLEYHNVRLIRRDATDIKVVGSTHEYYSVPSHYRTATISKGLLHINDVGDGKCKEDKYERDERLLRRELETDPENPRTTFYLANTLKDQGKFAQAIPVYLKRTQMGGFFAEADLSYTSLAQCYLGLDDEKEAETYALIAAYQRTCLRAEPLYYIAFYLHSKENYDLAWYYANMASKIPKPPVSHALFIHNDIYAFWIDYEKAMLPQYVFPKDRMLGMQHALHFLNNTFAPDYLRHMFVAESLAKYALTLSVSPSSQTNAVDDTTSPTVSSWHPLVVTSQGEITTSASEMPRMFTFFKNNVSRIVTYNGSLYALAPFQHDDLYCLVVFETDFKIRAYTYPFRFANIGKAELIDIEAPEGVPFLQLNTGHRIQLHAVLALSC